MSNRSHLIGAVAVSCAGLLLAAACSSGGTSTSSASGSPSKTAATATKTIGYVVAGDKNDGGFYEGQVKAVQKIGESLGYKTIVVDKVDPGASQGAFKDLARQGADVVIGGGQELTPGLVPVSQLPEFSKTLFILIGPSAPSTSSYATAGSDERQAHYLGGVAEGLLLKRANKSIACQVGGPELDFVKSAANELRAGLHVINKQYKELVTFTGDFENAALASEAAKSFISRGCQIIYPYLGGALGAVVTAGNQAGIDVVATSYNRCNDNSAKIAMSILYNPSIYLSKVIRGVADGKVQRGKQFALYGVKDGIGAVICNATPEEQKTLDKVKAKIASGEIDVSKVPGANG